MLVNDGYDYSNWLIIHCNGELLWTNRYLPLTSMLMEVEGLYRCPQRLATK